MEGLAAAGSIIAVVQIAAEISKLCGGYIRDVKHARGDIQRMESKVSALCGVLERFEKAPHLSINDATLIQCSKDLRSIKKKLEPLTKHKTIKRFGMRALKWPFTSKEVDEKVRMLEGYLHIFNTALHLDIEAKIEDAEGERFTEKLAYARDASFNSYENQRHRPCLENTRVEVLQDIERWAIDASPQCIFWLKGMAGTGKSTVAISVVSRLLSRSTCVATYFFRRGFGDLAQVRKLIPTVARQLSRSSPVYRRLVLAAIRADPDLGQSVNFRDQFERLLLEPLRMLPTSVVTVRPFFVVIDALDECDDEKDLRLLLRLLATTKDLASLHLRVLVTSRPEWVIEQGFQDMPSILYQDLVLHDVPRQVVDHDIEIFLRHELEIVRCDRDLPHPWPESQSISVLVSKAAGLFIFAATACRYIAGSPLGETSKRLSQVCTFVAQNHLMTEELDQMYTIVLQNSVKGRYTEDERQRMSTRFYHVVGSIVMLFTPLSMSELYRLLNNKQLPNQHRLEATIRPLYAVIDVPKDTSCSVQPLHLSFRDFLVDHDRCLDPRFQIDQRQKHQELTEDCIQLLSSVLHKDICQLPSPTTLVAEIAQRDIDKALRPAVQYACRYWALHAQKGRMDMLDNGSIHRFLRTHFLHWVEAMSLIGKTSETIATVIDLAALIDVVSNAPGQLYHSALLFSPLQSAVRRNFHDLVPTNTTFIPPVHEQWSASIQALEGHSHPVNTIVFSPDGKLVASGSEDHTVRLWDVQTGDSRGVLEGHSDEVTTVVFSLDGKLVASGSRDQTIRLWDVQNSDSCGVLEGHSESVSSVVFSPDSKLVASGSWDKTIRLWDVQTGDTVNVLEGHSDGVSTVVFSPNGRLVVSGSWDDTVQLWDVQTGGSCGVLEGHSDEVITVIFSPDGKLVASGSRDQTIRLWDVQNSDSCGVLEGHSKSITTVVFSPNGKLVASGSRDDTIRLWDVQTGDTVNVLEGHFSIVSTVVFSPNGKLLASGSWDDTIRLWDVQTGGSYGVLEGHSNEVTTIVFSPNGKLVASGSRDETVRLWDVQTGDTVNVLKGHSNVVATIVFSPNGKLVASGSWDDTIRLWDAQTGGSCGVLEGHSNEVIIVVFSPDDTLVASGSWDNTIRLWDVQTGDTVDILEGHSNKVTTVVFSPDGKLVASGSEDHTVRLWDVQTGGSCNILKGHSKEVTVVVFSPDDKLVASGSWDNTIRLWDIQTGDTVNVLEGHSNKVTTVVFSPDGKLVASGSEDHTVRLWSLEKLGHDLTVSLSIVPQRLDFDPDLDLLFINGVAFSIHSGTSAEKISAQGKEALLPSMIFANGEWVMKSSIRRLWLPPEHRPLVQASHGNTIVFGFSDGRISFLKLQS